MDLRPDLAVHEGKRIVHFLVARLGGNPLPAAEAKNQVSTTRTTSVICASVRPRGMVRCGSWASSGASATVSIITSHQIA